jgi:ubiquinone/menaquinone biosynthesis C-methylase UbiE
MRFIKMQNGELLCARCGSLQRDRRLYHLLQTENLLQGNVLDFSPSRSLYRKFKKTSGIKYFPSDYSNEFISDHRLDITAINLPDNSFDLIICYHILEHIPDDRKSMTELFRVLKPGGNIFIQTPFKEGEIYEDTSISTEAERKKHFGQADHVRIYSAEGLQERLKQAGFSVSILQFKENVFNKSGFSEKETAIRCRK